MTAGVNYFKIEFKKLLENYQEGFEQDSTHGKEKGECFRCSDCPFRSHKDIILRKHMRKLHEKRFKEQLQLDFLKCKLCSYRAGSLSNFSRHQKQKHMKIQNYQCSHCGYKSYFKYHVATHVTAKHKDSGARATKIGCTECQENVAHKKCQIVETSQKITSLFSCRVCDFETKVKSYLSRHKKLLHEPNADPSKVLTCTKCEYETKKIMCMTRHKNAQHINEKRFSCNLCGFKSFYKHHVKQHIRHNHKETKATVRKLKCPECRRDIAHFTCGVEKKAASKRKNEEFEEAQKHLSKTPIFDDQNLQCKDCYFETKNSSYMSRHTYLLHNLKTDEALIRACNSCEFQTLKVSSLNNHMKAQHLEEKRFACSVCGFKSFYKHHVVQHTANNHKALKESFVKKIDCSDCRSSAEHSICQRPPRRKQQIRNNILKNVHKNETLGCPDCHFKSKNRFYLKKHTKLMHGQNTDPMDILTCSNCEFETMTFNSMENHKSEQHLNEKRYNCSECDFRSFYRNNIRSHMKANHSDRAGEVIQIKCPKCRFGTKHNKCNEDTSESVTLATFQCSHCDFNCLNTKDSALIHMKSSHPEEKLFHCNRCVYKCNFLYNLRSHKRVQHKVKVTKKKKLEDTFSGIIESFRRTETSIIF